MSSKVLKIIAIVVGIILTYLAILLIRGKSSTLTPPTATLEFWNVFDKSDDWKPILQNLRQKYGIKVNYRSFTDLAIYRDTLLNELAAGEGPDLFALHNTWLGKYRKIIVPAPKGSGITPDSVAQDFLNAVSAGVIAEGENGNPEVLALPMYVDTLALYYDEGVFREKAYPRPETTWSGIQDDTTALAFADESDPEGFRRTGIAFGRASNIARAVDLYYLLYLQLGGKSFLDESGNPTISRGRAGSAALDLFTSFEREGYWNKQLAAEAPEQELDAFVRGKVAMIAGYSYTYSAIENLVGQYQRKQASGVVSMDNVKVALIPQVNDPANGAPKIALADYFALGVAKNSKNQSAAWQAIAYLTSREVQEQYHTATHKPTSRRDLVNSQQDDPIYGVFVQQAVYAEILPVADDIRYTEGVREMIDAVADGQMSVNTALRNFEIKLGEIGDRN